MKRIVNNVEEIIYSLSVEDVRVALETFIVDNGGILADDAILTMSTNGDAEFVSQYRTEKESNE